MLETAPALGKAQQVHILSVVELAGSGARFSSFLFQLQLTFSITLGYFQVWYVHF